VCVCVCVCVELFMAYSYITWNGRIINQYWIRKDVLWNDPIWRFSRPTFEPSAVVLVSRTDQDAAFSKAVDRCRVKLIRICQSDLHTYFCQ